MRNNYQQPHSNPYRYNNTYSYDQQAYQHNDTYNDGAYRNNDPYRYNTNQNQHAYGNDAYGYNQPPYSEPKDNTIDLLKDLDLLLDDDNNSVNDEDGRERSREHDNMQSTNKRKLRIISKDSDDEFINNIVEDKREKLEKGVDTYDNTYKDKRSRVDKIKPDRKEERKFGVDSDKKVSKALDLRRSNRYRSNIVVHNDRVDNTRLLHHHLTIPKDFETKKSFASRFKVLENLGQGGSSIVRKVVCLKDAKICAVKSCKSNDPTSISYIKKECKTLQMLSHPNIIKTYGIFESTSNVRAYNARPTSY